MNLDGSNLGPPLAAPTMLERTTELQLVLDNMPCLMALLDKDCRYRLANREYLRAFNKTDESIRGLHVRDVMGPVGWAIVEPYVKKVLSGNPVNYEAPIQFAKGPRFTQVNYIPHLDAGGEVVGFYVFALDVHTRRVAEETLRRNEQLLRVTLDAIVDSVFTIDKGGLILEINPAAARLIGRSGAEVKGQTLADYFVLLDADTRDPMTTLTHLSPDGSALPQRVECILKGGDGRERPAEVSVSPCYDDSGEPFGWLIVARDITQEKEMRDHMRMSDRMSAIGQLAGGIAHDFNNLLSAVLGSAQLVEQKEGKNIHPRSLEQLKSISQAARRAGQLSNRLISFARKGAQNHASIDARRVIQEVADILAHTVDKRVRIQVSHDAAENWILADVAEIESALLNVCINGSQAMPNGGQLSIDTRNFHLADEPRIQIRKPNGIDLGLEIKISDEGVGIAPDNLSRIFDPFFTTKSMGVGLGLVVVQRVMADHCGVVDVSSELGGGTVLRMRFPCVDSSIATASKQHGAASRRAEQLHILVVDDELKILEIAAEMLAVFGHTVSTASSGREAVKLFQQMRDSISLIILDLNMPDMNGMQTLAELRKAGASCSIVISTGYADADLLSETANLEILAVLKKPYDFDQLEVMLGTLNAKARGSTADERA